MWSYEMGLTLPNEMKLIWSYEMDLTGLAQWEGADVVQRDGADFVLSDDGADGVLWDEADGAVWEGADAVLRDGADVVAGTAHLRKDLVQPLEGAVQVDLYPARGRCHVLPETQCQG